MKELFGLKMRLKRDVDLELLEHILVHVREDDGRVRLTVCELFQLLHGDLGGRVACGADAQRDEHLVGVQKGTTADILMGDYESTQTINVTVVANDKLSNCFTQLTNGEIQAVVVDSGVAESYVAKNPELYKIVYQDMTEGEQFAIAMGLNDTDMQAAINQAMQELEEDGTLKEIYEYWFGADSEETAE